MIEKLKNVFDRASGSKKTFDDGGERKILSSAIVTGVATSTDAQLKSRFVHVQVASANRVGFPDHFSWFQTKSKDFFVLGRCLMRRRKEYVELVVEKIREWLASEEMEKMDPRARLVHGRRMRAFWAMDRLLSVSSRGLHPESRMVEFQKWTLAHCSDAVKEVQEQVNVDAFWGLVSNAASADAFGTTVDELRRVFRVIEDDSAMSPVGEGQTTIGLQHSECTWKSYLLYFRAPLLVDHLRRYLRSQGRELPFELSDLRAQMRTRDYWQKPKGNEHKQRFGKSKSPNSCWCISLDKHPLGFQPVSDDVFRASLLKNGESEEDGFLTLDEWVDPRRGDLFPLVEKLLGKEVGK
jgi:hypothetical protein